MFGNSICVSRIEIFNKRFGRLADEISQKVKPKYTHTLTQIRKSQYHSRNSRKRKQRKLERRNTKDE